MNARKINELIEVVKPLDGFKNNPLFIKFNQGIRAAGLGEDLEFVKKHLLIKHYMSDAFFSFNTYGEPPLYSLGELGLLTNELVNMWM